MKIFLFKKYKLTLKNISFIANAILLFSILIDPTNAFLGIKDIAFFLFVITSLPFVKFKNIFIFLTFISIYFFTLSIGLLTDQQIDLKFAFGVLKSFLFLSYLFWMNNDYLKSFSVFYKLSLLICVITIIMYILMTQFPFLERIIYLYLTEKNHVIAVGRRTFLGIQFYTVFMRTSSVCIISLPVALFFLFSKKEFKYFIHSCILFLGLFFSGTRANMLSGILIVVFFILFYLLYYKKALLSFIFTLSFTSLFGVVLVLQLLSEINHSNIVKTGHLESSMSLFSENPLRFLLVGTGPGSMFYTTGFDEVTVQTELTYLELIRNYGLIFTLLFIFIFCIPFLNIINNNKYDKLLKFSLFIGYLSYLFIAGTNPLLISSTGFIVIAIMFYNSQNNILEEMG